MIMKYAFATLVYLAASVCAQNVGIGTPAVGSTVTAGSTLNVQVIQSNAQQSATNVGLVIAMESCSGYSGGCRAFDVSQVLGQILYNGPYSPQQTNDPSVPPYENFTVTVPQSLAQGPAMLTVTQCGLGGAGPTPFIQVANLTVNVQ